MSDSCLGPLRLYQYVTCSKHPVIAILLQPACRVHWRGRCGRHIVLNGKAIRTPMSAVRTVPPAVRIALFHAGCTRPCRGIMMQVQPSHHASVFNRVGKWPVRPGRMGGHGNGYPQPVTGGACAKIREDRGKYGSDSCRRFWLHTTPGLHAGSGRRHPNCRPDKN